MGHAIGEVLAFGVGVTLSPLAVIAVVVMVAAPGGRRHAAAFVAAWVLSLTVVGSLVLLVADGADASDSGAPATWVSLVKLLLAGLLVVVAVRQWRARPAAGDEPELPAWIRRLDEVTVAKAARLGVVLAAVKPKNPLLTIGAALAVAQTGASAGGQAVALAVFVLVGTLSTAIPLAIAVLLPERGAGALARMRDWMLEENATIVAVLCVVLAAKLAGDAVVALTG